MQPLKSIAISKKFPPVQLLLGMCNSEFIDLNIVSCTQRAAWWYVF